MENATANLAYRELQRAVAREGGSCQALQARVPLKEVGAVPWLVPYNPEGRFLVDSGQYPRLALFDRIADRLCDLQGFQRLLALQVMVHERQVPDVRVPALLRSEGPDYADPLTGGPMQWDAQKRTLAFEARCEKDRKLLPWGI